MVHHIQVVNSKYCFPFFFLSNTYAKHVRQLNKIWGTVWRKSSDSNSALSTFVSRALLPKQLQQPWGSRLVPGLYMCMSPAFAAHHQAPTPPLLPADSPSSTWAPAAYKHHLPVCTQPWGVILQQPWAISPARVHWWLWEHWDPALLQASAFWEKHRVQRRWKFPSRETHRIRLMFFQQRGYLDRVLWPEHCSGSCVALQDKDSSVISASTTSCCSTQWVVVQLQQGQFFLWKSAARQTTGCDAYFSHPAFVTTIY